MFDYIEAITTVTALEAVTVLAISAFSVLCERLWK